jgi:hypothetical protein
MRQYILFLLHIAIPSILLGQLNPKGVIFEDANNNGKFDKNETGIANVAVSNGIDVVLSDQKGNYSLPPCQECVIFVIKPTTHEIPRNNLNHHNFYYIHKPNGSPKGLKYEASSSTGPLPASLDFGLIKSQSKSDTFKFLVFGDPQPYNLKELEYFDRGFIEEAKNEENITFGITLGDIVGDDLTLHDDYLKVISKVGRPWYAVIGNHDMNFDVKDDSYSDESFESTFGPTTYAFNYGNVHYIVLDDILYPDPRDGSGYWGGLREDQLKFVENDLKFVPKDKLIVLFMHIPIFEENGDSFRDEDRKKLLELISPFKNSVSFSAHTHYQTQAFFGKESGYNHEKLHHHHNIGTPSGDWYSGRLNKAGLPDSRMRDGTPKGFVIVTVDGTDYKTEYKVAGEDKSYQMQIYNPKVIKKDLRTSAGIFVNFFMGSKNDKVRYRIDGGVWKNMQNITAHDPSYLKELIDWDSSEVLLSGRRPSNPELTNHLWRIGVPNNLELGEHVIEVEATDMFGQVYTAKSMYRIED